MSKSEELMLIFRCQQIWIEVFTWWETGFSSLVYKLTSSASSPDSYLSSEKLLEIWLDELDKFIWLFLAVCIIFLRSLSHFMCSFSDEADTMTRLSSVHKLKQLLTPCFGSVSSTARQEVGICPWTLKRKLLLWILVVYSMMSENWNDKKYSFTFCKMKLSYELIN